MCSALLPKSPYQMIHVFSAFFSGNRYKSCSLAASSYSKSTNSWSCGVCFSKQSQEMAMSSRAKICHIHISKAWYKRRSAVVPSWPSLPTNSFIFYQNHANWHAWTSARFSNYHTLLYMSSLLPLSPNILEP